MKRYENGDRKQEIRKRRKKDEMVDRKIEKQKFALGEERKEQKRRGNRDKGARNEERKKGRK